MGLFVLTIDRDAVAATYLKGNGIEIGALHNPLKVGEKARVRYLDRMSVADLRRQYPELAKEKLVNVDIVDDGEHLATVADESQDFVIANHFVEHSQNPLRAIANMFRVLKIDGVLYIALPDKRYSFDVDRPVTPLDHLLRDFREGPEWSRKGHFEEWVRLVSKVEHPKERDELVNKLIAMDYSIHFHVWSQKEMVELVLFLRTVHSFEIELMLRGGVENIFILRKTARSVGSLC
ncbi:methyltransferase domain-containing protein [Geobacter sp. AOG1]|uniref:methyltransferase domain-containing protein n=1 Tax=Geobacter sp. AOG1 TaxID=1566346 RepID=UPI001CC60ED4|nr:methyltransferase domain-containing protein [Geobacter sp. AOG1]